MDSPLEVFGTADGGYDIWTMAPDGSNLLTTSVAPLVP